MTSILVTEDDEMIRDMLSRRLQRAGFEVSVAEDGAKALQILEDNQFDLVLLDVMMPGVDGYEVLERIKAHDTWRDTPVIMLTAVHDKTQVLKCLQLGASNYVVKPFDMAELKLRIGEALDEAAEKRSGQDVAHTNSNATSAAGTPQEKSKAVADSDPVIEQLVSRLKKGDMKFPILPDVAFNLIDLLENDNVSLNELSEIIKGDPSLSASLIKLANSSLFMTSKPVSQVDNAISRIGLKSVAQYLMPIVTTGMFNAESPLLEGMITRLWKHSQACGIYAKRIGKAISYPNTELLFTMGLFHDIGKLFLLDVLQDLSRKRPMEDETEIENMLSELHAEFGEALLKRWELPVEFTAMAGHHHLDRGEVKHCQEVYIINLADSLARHQESSDFQADGAAAALDVQLTRLDIDSTQLADVMEQAKQEIAAVESVS